MPTHKGTRIIETRRLILRPAALEDAEAMYANWAADPEVTKYLTWPPHSSPELSRQILQSWVEGYSQDNFYQWQIVLKELGQPIGSISAMNPDDSLSSVEIGYCIGRNWWHRGITAQALQAVIDYLFGSCGFRRITARHDINNPNSGRVMRKCAMTYEGTLRQSGRNNQGICDMAHYSILYDEWAKNRP